MKNIPAFFIKKKSFAFYLSLLVLSTVIGVFSLLLVYNYYISRELLLKNVEENTRNIVSSATNKSEGFFYAIEKIALNSALFITRKDKDLFTTEMFLRDLLHRNPEIFGSCMAFKPYVNNSDTIYYAPYCWVCDKGFACKDLGEKSYFYPVWEWYYVPASQHKPIWSEPYFDEGGGNTLMTTFSVPVYEQINDTATFKGILTVDVSLHWLNDLLSGIKIFDSGYAFLLSKSGKIISHPHDSALVDRNILDIAAANNDKELLELSSKMLSKAQGFEKVNKGFFGEESWVYHIMLDNNGWVLGFVFPESELYEDLHELNTLLVIIFILGILLLLILIVWISGRLTKPVRKLAGIMDVSGENFVDAEIPEIAGSKEIEILNKAFRQLQNDIKNYVSHVKELTASRQMLESEMEIARKLQFTMLPDIKNILQNEQIIDISTYIKPAKTVGGDFYFLLQINDNQIFFAIGDVSGKGMGASLFMSVTVTLLRAYAQIANGNLKQIIGFVSDYLCRNNRQKYFVSVFAGVLNKDNGAVEYVNAGHNYPALITDAGQISFLTKVHCPPLGIIKPKTFESDAFGLNPGDKIILYTDGLTEAMNENKLMFEQSRLKEVLTINATHNIENIINKAIETVSNFTIGAEQHDDITLLGLEMLRITDKNSLNLHFENAENISILQSVFEKIEMFGDKSGIQTKAIYKLKLVLEELITNIVKYGFSDIAHKEIRVNIQNSHEFLSVKVSDFGIDFNILDAIDEASNKLPDKNTIGKRGLVLIAKMAYDISYKREENMNKTTFKIKI